MAFDDIITKVQGWATGTEALAVLGAKLTLQQRGESPDPRLASTIDSAITAAGLDGVDELPPPQRATLLAMTRLFAHQMLDVLDQPERAPGWSFTDPDILDGWGRGSMMLPMMIASAHPSLQNDVERFLDVGTGVGLLACAAASVWPTASIVGIDVWEPSLARARANVAAAGLSDRIELRDQRLEDLSDQHAFDCAWLPTFFFREQVLIDALPAVVRAVRPGGWIVLGRMRSSPDPLAAALLAFRTARSGGDDLDTKRLRELLDQAGCTTLDVGGPPASAIELVVARTPD
jgi:predicted O-methyltransferase YrrM